MGWKKSIVDTARNVSLSAAVGGVVGLMGAMPGRREEATREGALAGAGLGALASLPLGKIARAAMGGTKIFGKGLMRTPGPAGHAIRSSIKVQNSAKLLKNRVSAISANRGKTIFRRVRGRLIPIKVK